MTTQTVGKKEVGPKRKSLPELLNDPDTRKRFEGMLGKDARSFQQNILTVYNGSKGLQECEPESIIAACGISASINLSILPSLGQSCIVPYKDGDELVAQWQIQWKGLVQLAHRTSQYKRINLAHVYEGQFISHDEFKGIVHLDASKKTSSRVQGYYFYFELLSGSQFEFYWSAKKCIEHGLRYSKSFQKGRGRWTEDPEFEKTKTVKKWLAAKTHFLTEGSGADSMSAKTIVKNMLNKWGPLETRIKEIVQTNDQAVIGNDGKPTYIDTTAETTEEPKTYTAPPMAEKGKSPPPAEKIEWVRNAAEKQGVSGEQFDAWLATQSGTEADKAAAVEAAWKTVLAKKAKATEFFAVKAELDEKDARDIKIEVSMAAKTEFYGEEAYVIRDASEPPIKYYTDQEAIYKAAKDAKKAEKKLSVRIIKREADKETVLWITRLV